MVVTALAAAGPLALLTLAALSAAAYRIPWERRPRPVRWCLVASVALPVALAVASIAVVRVLGPERWTFEWAPWPSAPIVAGIEAHLLGTMLSLAAATTTALAWLAVHRAATAPPAPVAAGMLASGGLAALLGLAPDIFQAAWLWGALAGAALWLGATTLSRQSPTWRCGSSLRAAHAVLTAAWAVAGAALLLGAVWLARVNGSSATVAIASSTVSGWTSAAMLSAGLALAVGIPLWLLARSAPLTGPDLLTQVPAATAGWILVVRVAGWAGGPEHPLRGLVVGGLALSAWAAVRIVRVRARHLDVTEQVVGLASLEFGGLALAGLGAGERGWPGAAVALLACTLLLVLGSSPRAPQQSGLALLAVPLTAALTGRALVYWAAADRALPGAVVLLLGLPACSVAAAAALDKVREGRGQDRGTRMRRVNLRSGRVVLLLSAALGSAVRLAVVLALGEHVAQVVLPAPPGNLVARLTGLTAAELALGLLLAAPAAMGGVAVIRDAGARAGQPRPATVPPYAAAAAWRTLQCTTEGAAATWHAALRQLHQRYYVIAALMVGLGTVLLLAH